MDGASAPPTMSDVAAMIALDTQPVIHDLARYE
jgi:hypothetical protein